MNATQVYLAISIVALIFIAVLFFLVIKDKKEKRLSPLAGVAFGFILAGIIFGEDKLVGYGLMGVGVAIAVVDIILGLKSGSTRS